MRAFTGKRPVRKPWPETIERERVVKPIRCAVRQKSNAEDVRGVAKAVRTIRDFRMPQ